jgi:hypothetical protein
MTTHYGRDALAVLTSNAPDYEDLDEGQQGKYNHADCPAGADNKHRLYVKNVDGAYLWHCHNCGDSGYYRPKETVKRIKEETTTAVFPKGTHMPTHAELTVRNRFDSFDIAGQMWLLQYGFNDVKCDGYHITEGVDGIVLPVFSGSGGGIAGCQVRRYNKKPKYLTYSKQRYSYLNTYHTAKPLIVVEDLLSSYKLHMAGYPTLCLLGTKMDKQATMIATAHGRVVLWLDDDVAGHTAARKLFVDLGPLCPSLTAIFNHQPKELDLETLREMEL